MEVSETTWPSFFYPATEPNERLNIQTQDLQSYKLFFILLSTTEQIILRFFYPLPSLKIGGELSRGQKSYPVKMTNAESSGGNQVELQ